MIFQEFRKKWQTYANKLLKDAPAAFLASTDPDKLWNLYLDSFPVGANEIYRTRREYDCSCCRHFFKSVGNLVVVNPDYTLSTLWDVDIEDDTFTPVLAALSAYVKDRAIQDVLAAKNKQLGTAQNLEQLDSGLVHTWYHFNLDLPERLVLAKSDTIGTVRGKYRDNAQVFKRSLEELSAESVDTVLDLIAERALYRGEEWQSVLEKFKSLQRAYQKLPAIRRDNFCWSKSISEGGAVTRIRNHSIGTLLQDLTSEMELDAALRRYEAIVAPTNYKRPKAVFTAKMVDQAQKKLEALGLAKSLGRQHATLSDITVRNILWANRDAARFMDGAAGVFESLKQDVTIDPRKYDRAKGIPVDKFMAEVLPSAKNLAVLFENKHAGNLVSLIAPQDPDSPSLFKWSNGFSWAYVNNVADSMKQRVKAAGGNVEGVLRFSLLLNEQGDNNNDYDAHCIEPDKNEIWFQNKGSQHPSSGILDVDVINPDQKVAVENITWTNRARMQEGIYELFVHNYTHRGGTSGFSAEIEYGGQIYSYAYHRDLKQNENVQVARLQFSRRDGIKFLESLPDTHSSKTLWGLKTNNFQPVSVCMFSPNYWDGQTGIGNRHYFFMLANCVNPDRPNGFFNEYLREEFMPHRQVFEALGGKMKVAETDNQLSGLGFSTTKRDSLLVKADNRIVKIIF